MQTSIRGMSWPLPVRASLKILIALDTVVESLDDSFVACSVASVEVR